MNILLACDNSSILNTILFIKRLIDIIFIVAPIVLVLLLTIDIAKNVLSKDDNENKKNITIAIKRLVYCIVLFFVPLIIDSIMSYLDGYNVNFAKCYEKATEENVQKLYNSETEKFNKKQEEVEKKREENASKVKNETTKEEAAAKKAAAEAAKKVAEAATKTAEAITESTGNYDSGGNISNKAEKLASTAESLAWPENTAKSKYDHDQGGKPYGDSKKYKKKYNIKANLYDCGGFVILVTSVVQDKKVENFMQSANFSSYKKRVEKYGYNATRFDGKISSLKRGDILTYKRKTGGGQHVMIYLGTKNGKPYVAEAAYIPKSRNAKKYRKWYAKINKLSSGKQKLSNKSRYYRVRANS